MKRFWNKTWLLKNATEKWLYQYITPVMLEGSFIAKTFAKDRQNKPRTAVLLLLPINETTLSVWVISRRFVQIFFINEKDKSSSDTDLQLHFGLLMMNIFLFMRTLSSNLILCKYMWATGVVIGRWLIYFYRVNYR